MEQNIYFLRTRDMTRFKIGRTNSLQTRYPSLVSTEGDIFDIGSSFFLAVPNSANAAQEERAFHSAFREYQIGGAKSEWFFMECYHECLERASAFRTRSGSAQAWTIHSLADFFEKPRTKIAERLAQRLIAAGHEQLSRDPKIVTHKNRGKELKTVWLPIGMSKAMKQLAFYEIDGRSSAESHFTCAIQGYVNLLSSQVSGSVSGRIDGIEYACRPRERYIANEGVSFKLPAGLGRSLGQLAVDERDGLKSEQAHMIRAFYMYLEQRSGHEIEQGWRKC